MAGAIGKYPLGHPKTELELFDRVEPGSNNTIRVVYAGGTVRSVQPDGRVEVRPAGSDGPYERACVNGGVITYCPDGKTAYDFSFSPRVPNV